MLNPRHIVALSRGVQLGSGCLCAVCGESPFAPTDWPLGENFSDWEAVDGRSEIVCEGCRSLLSGRPGDDPPPLRTLHVLAVEGEPAVYPGRLHPLGQVWPASQETAFIHPLLVGPHHAESLISEVSLVRHVGREEQEPDVSGVTPMPTTTEVLSAGTRLVWFARFAGSATPIERAVIPWAISQITHLGGKHNAGMGAVDIVMDGPDADPTPYAEWLAQTPAADIRARLLALSATL